MLSMLPITLSRHIVALSPVYKRNAVPRNEDE